MKFNIFAAILAIGTFIGLGAAISSIAYVLSHVTPEQIHFLGALFLNGGIIGIGLSLLCALYWMFDDYLDPRPHLPASRSGNSPTQN